MKNNLIVAGYLKSSVLIDINGDSIGESPHITFQIIFPIAREIYVSDTSDNVFGNLMEALYRTGYIKNKSDYEISETDSIVKILRKGEIYE